MKLIVTTITSVALACISIPVANAKPSGRILLTMPPILAAQKNTPQPPPSTTAKTVISAGGRVWMDRNLGASRVATSPTDVFAYGDLYQWGRLADGHESRTSPSTYTLSETDVPIDGSFILTSRSPYDWRTPQNNTLWQGVSGTNNPCPSGFRLPTVEEWWTELASWSTPNAAGAFASPLKLVLGGYRRHYEHDDGAIFSVGTRGFYWSSTVYGHYCKMLEISSTEDTSDSPWYFSRRSHGFSVRCIKD